MPSSIISSISSGLYSHLTINTIDCSLKATYLSIMESSPHSSIILAAQVPIDSSVMVSATLEEIEGEMNT